MSDLAERPKNESPVQQRVPDLRGLTGVGFLLAVCIVVFQLMAILMMVFFLYLEMRWAAYLMIVAQVAILVLMGIHIRDMRAHNRRLAMQLAEDQKAIEQGEPPKEG